MKNGADGRLVGTNTDGQGFVTGLREAGHELSGRHVLLAGAGGAGRSPSPWPGRARPCP